MKSEVTTKLSLPEFARIIGINPLHFMGVQIESIMRRQCTNVIFQHEWQSADGVSREEIAQAIRDAEDEIEGWLGYRLLPAWEEEEWEVPMRSRYPEMINVSPYDTRGMLRSVRAKWGHLVTPGRRTKTLLGDEAPIVWDSAFGANPANDYMERGTITATVPEGTAECEIALYHPGREGDDRYRIRPITVAVSGTTATITFRRELAALLEADTSAMDFPLEYPQEAIASGGDYLRPIDGTDDAHFEEALDVYRLWNDPQQQADLLWFPPGGCCPSNIGALATQAGALTIVDPELGWLAFQPATWDATTGAFTGAGLYGRRQPEAVKLYYKAGLRGEGECPDQHMQRRWAVVVAELALARLDREICACETTYTKHSRDDLARSGADFDYKITERMLDNPIGTRMGEVRAWRAIQRPGAALSRSAT